MAGAADLIFGTSPSVTTTSQPTKTPTQLTGIDQIIRQLQGGTGSGSQSSNLQGLSLAALEQQVMNEATGGPGSNKAAALELDKLIKKGGSPIDIQDYFTKSVEDPMLFDFKNKILPMLQSSFAGSSAFGSDKLKQQELLTENLTRNLTSSRADISYKSASDAANRMMQALGLTPAVNAGETAVTTAGQQPQNTQVMQLLQALGINTIDPTTVVQPGSTGLMGGISQVMTAMMMSNAAKGSGGFFSGAGDWLSSLFSSGASADSLALLAAG